MLGKKLIEDKIFTTVSLSSLVPKNHFYRRVEALLDLRFVYQDCEEYYGKTGRPSLDPMVFFKMLLYGYFENIQSDRELLKRISDSLSARYFIGYDLDEELPWHSTISRTRGLLGEKVFTKIFTKIVEKCIAHGLVDGSHQSVDSTLVKANAAKESLEWKSPPLTVAEYIERTGNQEESPEEQAQEESGQSTASKLSHIPIEKNERGSKKASRNEHYVSRSDPESKLASKPNALPNLYYSTHYVVDTRRVITAVLTTTADRGDSQDMLACVDRATRLLASRGLTVKSVGADRGYCSGENLRTLEQQGITPFMPRRKSVNTTGKFGQEKFQYDSQKNLYVCPNGKAIKHHGSDMEKKVEIYLSDPASCKGCPLREQCTTNPRGRKLVHSIYREEYQRQKIRIESAAGRKAMKIRKTVTEPLFAEAKENHGLRKFMTRGLDKAKKNSYLIAVVQNIKRLMITIKRAQSAVKLPPKGSFFHTLEILLETTLNFLFGAEDSPNRKAPSGYCSNAF